MSYAFTSHAFTPVEAITDAATAQAAVMRTLGFFAAQTIMQIISGISTYLPLLRMSITSMPPTIRRSTPAGVTRSSRKRHTTVSHSSSSMPQA